MSPVLYQTELRSRQANATVITDKFQETASSAKAMALATNFLGAETTTDGFLIVASAVKHVLVPPSKHKRMGFAPVSPLAPHKGAVAPESGGEGVAKAEPTVGPFHG